MRKVRSTVTEIIVMLFVMLFLYTGISKLTDYIVFKEQIATSPILAPIAPFVAKTLPWTEFLVVVLLVVPRWRLKGLYASVGLMTLFTGYIIAVLTFNKDIPCSCGGVIELLSWKQHIVFNSIFIVLGLIALVFERGIRRENRQTLSAMLHRDDRQMTTI